LGIRTALERGVRARLPGGLRDWLRWNVLPRDVSWVPAVIPGLEARRVAVLAPHPDDDVIGCGGTLRKHCLAGGAATVIYLTDGARGADHAAPPVPATAARRRREAETALDVIGVRDRVFWGVADGCLRRTAERVARLTADLERADPEAVLLPSALDGHPDHRAANRIFAAAARNLGGPLKVYAYEVWVPLPANCLVDISDVLRDKERALGMHRSQTRRADLAAPTLGLNRFRGFAPSRGRGFYEAFLALDGRRYAELVRRTLERRGALP